MINPKAIDTFIRAPRDDWRWIKEASLADLRDEFGDVPVITDPYTHQWASLALGVANPEFMFFLDMGLGKALLWDSVVLTTTGWTPIRKLEQGQYILHPSGRTTRVDGIYPQGVKPIFRVHFSDGTSTECCDEHLWTVCDERGGNRRTLTLREIMSTPGAFDDQPVYHIPLVEELDLAGADPLWQDFETRYDRLMFRLDAYGEFAEPHCLSCELYNDEDVEELLFLARSTGNLASVKTNDDGNPVVTVDLVAKGRAIEGVSYLGVKEAVCIKVSEEDGLFITNDFIVTHNTKLLLDLFKFRKDRGEAKRALVLVPNFTNIQSWVDEIEVHQPSLTGIGLEGTAKQRKALLEADGDVWIINYQGLQALATTTLNRKRIIDYEAIERVSALFDMIGMDEIHKCKNPDSLTFELCRHLCDAASFRYGLTGTPFGRDPMDLWAQFFLIDRGASLGAHPQVFKETFFDRTMNKRGFVEWVFDKRKKRLLNRMIQHRSIRYRDSECMDLPKQVFRPVRVPMSKDAVRVQREMLEEIQAKAMAGELDDAQQQENTFMRMRTLASGFMRVYELDDEGKKTKHYDDIIFKDNPKLDALVDLIESLPEGEKMVVFHEFIATGQMIEAALKKAKIKHLALNAATKDKKAFLKKFREDDSFTVAVVNSKSGSTGLNLQRANHMAFFESPVSPIERQQAEKRTHRGGQRRRCYYYDLITIGSVDERIQEFIAEGKDLMQAVVEQKGGGFMLTLVGGTDVDGKSTKKGRGKAPAKKAPKRLGRVTKAA